MNNKENQFIVELKNITKRFPGVLALEDVNFSLKRGSVHGLAGENGAGKSTLMNILAGVHTSYEGKVFIQGEEVHFHNENDALETGVSIVHQELNYIPELSIEENIFMGREFVRIPGILDYRTRHQEAIKLLNQLGLDYDPREKMKNLSFAHRQMVEIIKAISRKARIIIMDEPSSALSPNEIELLFQQIRKLKANGIAIIYITHKLEEIFNICDTISVLRDGKYVGSNSTDQVDTNDVITMMVGRSIKDVYPTLNPPQDEELLIVEKYSSGDLFKNISFTVHKGEVLGIAGMMGSGRSEIVRSIFGLDKHTDGKLIWEGKKIDINKPKDAIDNGIGMVTEDRKEYGFVPMRSIIDNVSLPNMEIFAPHGLLKFKLIYSVVKRVVDSISLKYPKLEALVMNLSGGNQQKVVLAKWMVCNMKLLIMDEPTRGIDVGAKQEVYRLIKQFADKGMGVILIASEMPELIAMSHRIIVLSDGEIKGELPRGKISQDAIMKTIVNGGKK